jgi:hypothetical protein
MLALLYSGGFSAGVELPAAAPTPLPSPSASASASPLPPQRHATAYQCSEEETKAQALKVEPKDSSCYSRHYFPAVSAAGLHCRSLTVVDIGANKGYLLALWLDLFRPHLQITPAGLYRYIQAHPTLGTFVDSRFVCGACGDCHTEHTRVRRGPGCVTAGGAAGSSPSLLDANYSLDMYAIEPVPANGKILREGLMSLLASRAAELGDARVSLTFDELAVVGTEETKEIQFGLCPPGHEVCGVKRDGIPGEVGGGPSAYEVGTVAVNASTLDAWAARRGFLRRGNSSSSSYGAESIQPQRRIDVLAVDTEGLDALVLQGGVRLFTERVVRVLLFEYVRGGLESAVET